MAKTKVLVTVKTYPCLSQKYEELVCTAGFLEDGNWIRIYPVPFRKLGAYDQYSKYDWIELDLVKNPRDVRPESYRPANIDAGIAKVGHWDTGKKRDWALRKSLVLKNVYTNMTTLLEDCKNNGTSLAVMKANVTGFKVKEVERNWDPQKLEAIKNNQCQLDLFEERKTFELVKKLPYEFSYVFTTDDGKERALMIEDWELGMLYWNSLTEAKGDEVIACRKVKEKYFDYMAGERDLYLFLGTSLQWQQRNSPDPFMVIGTFFPPKTIEEPTLF